MLMQDHGLPLCDLHTKGAPFGWLNLKNTSSGCMLLCGHMAYNQTILCAKRKVSLSPGGYSAVQDPKSWWVEHELDINSQVPWLTLLCSIHTTQLYMAVTDLLTPQGSLSPLTNLRGLMGNIFPIPPTACTCFTWYGPSLKYFIWTKWDFKKPDSHYEYITKK